jgi:hypothetical protein
LRWLASAGGATAEAVTPIIPKQTTAVITVFWMALDNNLDFLLIAFHVIS